MCAHMYMHACIIHNVNILTMPLVEKIALTLARKIIQDSVSLAG